MAVDSTRNVSSQIFKNMLRGVYIPFIKEKPGGGTCLFTDDPTIRQVLMAYRLAVSTRKETSHNGCYFKSSLHVNSSVDWDGLPC